MRNTRLNTLVILAFLAILVLAMGCGSANQAPLVTGNMDASQRQVREYVIKGENNYSTKQWDEIIADCTKTIELIPKDAAAYKKRGAAYHAKGDYDKAIADFNNMMLSSNFDAYYCRGAAYAGKGDYDKAIADFNNMIALDPNDSLGYFARGFLVYNAKGDYEKAIADYTKTIELLPEWDMPYTYRGQAYEAIGEKSKAEADFQKARELGADVHQSEDMKLDD